MPDQDIEDAIEHLMGDADYGLFALGRNADESQRVLDFQGDSPTGDNDFPTLFMIHGELRDIHPGISWMVRPDE